MKFKIYEKILNLFAYCLDKICDHNLFKLVIHMKYKMQYNGSQEPVSENKLLPIFKHYSLYNNKCMGILEKDVFFGFDTCQAINQVVILG